MREILNCPNCAAPITSDICPYCGSVFLDWASFDMKRPTFVKVKDDFGHVNLVKIKLKRARFNVEYEDDSACIYADNEPIITLSKPSYSIDAEFDAIPFDISVGKHERDDVYRLSIDPVVADPDLVKDILKETIHDERQN